MQHVTLVRLMIVLIFLVSWIPPAYSAPAADVHSGKGDPIWRLISKFSPSTSRRLSTGVKGEIGEVNITPAMRRLVHELGEELQAEEWFLEKGTLEHGVDALFRNVSRRRFNVVESKATTHKGVLYAGVLGESAAGQQMSNRWIKNSLRDLFDRADNLARDAGTSPERRRAATQLLNTIREIDGMRYKRIDKTLVVTRLQGVDRDLLDPSRNVFRSIHPNLLAKFDNVIEVDRNGRVLHVVAGSLK